MTVPISEQATQNLQKTKPASNPSQSPSPVLNQIDLPKELWKVMNFLWNSNMFRIESLFLYHGDLVISTYIRQCLDTGEQFDTNTLLGNQDSDKLSLSELTLKEESVSKRSLDKEAISANSMIDVLVAFLDCLPDPVIPTSMYERALEASESVDAMNMLKESLPPFRRNVLLYIGMFLRQAIDHAPSSVRKERENKIVELFTVLLRPPVDFKERNPLVAKEKREKFILQLLKSLKDQ
ncbi:hypothetical protein CU097_005366 [Rhizopus azygosporus]|nr:hypothetical protein CU097_005366 [Rhizopus azygosporus]